MAGAAGFRPDPAEGHGPFICAFEDRSRRRREKRRSSRGLRGGPRVALWSDLPPRRTTEPGGAEELVRALALVLTVSLLLGGCHSVDVYTGARVEGEPIEDTAYLWLWGVIGDDKDIPAHQGASRVKVYRSFPGWLVAIFTLGILQPMHVQVWPVIPPEAPQPGAK